MMKEKEEDLDKALNRLNNFQHPAIDPRTQTRLLRISQPAQAPTPIYTLETHELRDLAATRYRALSYTWGPAAAAAAAAAAASVSTVVVSGQVFTARANLVAFLEAAAARAETGLFFIDAVCINQLDRVERAAQVAAMARIFRCADEVVAWLGTPPECEADGVRALAAAVTERRRGGGGAGKKTKATARWSAAEWAGLRYLSYHAYWQRVWIVQEVVLARRVAVWCGVFVIPLSVLGGEGAAGAQAVSSSSYLTGVDGKGRPGTYRTSVERALSPAEVVITHRLRYVLRPARRDPTAQGTRVGTMDEMMADLRGRRGRQWGSSSSHTTIETYHSTTPDLLHHMMRKFGRQECSNPRDRLYGFLGMLAERSRNLVVPDYGRDVRYAFYQALRVGMGEIYGELDGWRSSAFGGGGGGSGRQWNDNNYLGFFCDARDAFGVGHDVSMAVLRDVVGELGFRGKFQEATLEMQRMNQYNMRDFRGRPCPDLKGLLGYVEEEEKEEAEGDLGFFSRFHKRRRWKFPRRGRE